VSLALPAGAHCWLRHVLGESQQLLVEPTAGSRHKLWLMAPVCKDLSKS